MKSFTIRLAGQYFTICPVCDYIREYCRDYIMADDKRGPVTETGGTGSESTTENTVACAAGSMSESVAACATESPVYFTIVTTQSDIDFEREKSAREDTKEGIPIRHFSDAYLETLAVYRKIADHLLSCDTLLFHGSVIAVDGEGYLFTAKSGTGKSTHTRLWREYFGERAVMVNDEAASSYHRLWCDRIWHTLGWQAQTQHEYCSTAKGHLHIGKRHHKSYRTGRAACSISAYRPADEPQLIGRRNEADTVPHRPYA